MALNTDDLEYYPPISDLITVDDWPESLSFLTGELQYVFDNLYYKAHIKSKSTDGTSAFHSLDIVSRQKLAFELAGTGISFVLNPDYNDDTISSFPITVFWKWQILKFINYFKANSFSFSTQDLFNIGLEIFNTSEEQALSKAANIFVSPLTSDTSPFEQLVADINLLYSSNIIIDPYSDTKYQDLIIEVGILNHEVFPTIFSLYIATNDPANAVAKLNDFFATLIPGSMKDYLTQLIIPKARVALELSAAIEFPRSVLLPMTSGQNGYQPDNTLDSAGMLKTTYIQFGNAILELDTQSGLGYQNNFSGTLYPSYAQIGNTGILISFSDVKLDLSRTNNIPEADAAGYPVDFMGVYLQQASVIINGLGTDDSTNASVSLSVKNFLIGSGGISGIVTLSDTGVLYRKFGDFSVGLDSFSVTFRQNAIIDCAISGKLTLNKFTVNGDPAVIDIEASIRDNGDFSITAIPSPNLITITFPNVFDLHIRSLAIGKTDRGYYFEIAGQLDFIADVPLLGEILPKGIEIKKLLIWDNGNIEFQGGGLVVPKSFSLRVGPVNLEVNNLTLGPYNKNNRKYLFFGFDGMINAGSAGFSATGNGIKYYFTIDDNGTDKPFNHFLSIDGIAIDLVIPAGASKDDAAFILHGFLGMHNPNNAGTNAATEYTGSVTVSMPKLDISGSAGMRLQPSVPSFIVDLGLEFSVPLPLASTGLGIYGFRGLFGKHYLPSKSATTPPLDDSASWWDYYKAPSIITHHEGIEIDKFASEGGYSIGAGVSIATAFDTGFIFSSKLFLVLGLPDVFLIQGQAALISSRIGLNDTDDPPFSAFIAIDGHSFTSRFEVDYDIPSGGDSNGDILDIHGYLDMAFYFNNSSAWYINAGKDQPESARIQAKILTLFQGYAYLMLSSQGIKTGAGAKFAFNKKFGPASVGIGAYLDTNGFISFKPVQIGGSIEFGGYAFVKIFCIKLGLSVRVYLAVEAPHPFNITGGLEVKVHVIFKTITVKVDISWHFNSDSGPLHQPIPVLSIPDPSKGYLPAVATNILSNETFTLNYITVENATVIPKPGDGEWAYNFTDTVQGPQVTIPLDSFIDINLLKPVKPGDGPLGGTSNQLADGYSELLPPQKGVAAQVKHEYELTGLDIYAWSGDLATGQWMPYNIYEATTAIVNSNTGDGAIDLSQLKPGYWQFTEPNKFNKIRLLSQNMFSYVSSTDSSTSDLDGRNFTGKAVFCYDDIIGDVIINWKDEDSGTAYAPGSVFHHEGLSFNLFNLNAAVENDSYYGDKSLQLGGQWGYLDIQFPQPVSYIKTQLGANQNDVKIDYVKVNFLRGEFGVSIPVNQTLKSDSVAKSQQHAFIEYDDIDNPVNSIRISLNKTNRLNYTGDLIIGGHYSLPDQYITPNVPPVDHDTEAGKALMFVTVYNRSFNATEILNKSYRDQTGVTGQWVMENNLDTTANQNAIINGTLNQVPGFYEEDTSGIAVLHQVYAFADISDALIVPNNTAITVENSSFSFEATAIFSPFAAGLSTLLYKVNIDEATGFQKGFALHLSQNTPGTAGATYQDEAAVPSYSIWFTCYNETESWGTAVNDKYTVNCQTSGLDELQYKNIFISVNRDTGKLEIYIDRNLKTSVDIPPELAVFSATATYTDLNEITCKIHSLHQRQLDNPITAPHVINEVQVLSDSLSRSVQPVWRPDTTFAVSVKTRDRINNVVPPNTEQTHVFGFKTAGPVGHFHQQNPQYQALAAADRGDEFKLTNLKQYIDYERSFPDAQGRYNLSKPVFCHNPQVKLFFTMPYINAMYADWAAYQGLAGVNSSLELALVDTQGNVFTPQPVWETSSDILIDDTNYDTLPEDQKTLYLLNKAAAAQSCYSLPSPVKKHLQRGSYQFDTLKPQQLYTALFSAVYQPDGMDTAQKQEVHKFTFITSRFMSFQEQAGSFVLVNSTTSPQYAVYPRGVIFSDDEINQRLKKLINDDPTDDPDDVARYATKFDRLLFGGLQETDWEPIAYSVITVFVNTIPSTGVRSIMGVLVRNPEPFNDPKLPADLRGDTVSLTLTGTDGQPVAETSPVIYVHAGDLSAVFITNQDMNIPAVKMQLAFRQKLFDGTGYSTQHEDYESPLIDLAPFLL